MLTRQEPSPSILHPLLFRGTTSPNPGSRGHSITPPCIIDLSDDKSFGSSTTVVHHRRLPKVGEYELQDEALTPRSFFIFFRHVYVS